MEVCNCDQLILPKVTTALKLAAKWTSVLNEEYGLVGVALASNLELFPSRVPLTTSS
jgi:hypothetical protein